MVKNADQKQFALTLNKHIYANMQIVTCLENCVQNN